MALALLLALSTRANAEATACSEGPILEAKLEGCEGACASRGPLMRLLALVKLGEPLSADAEARLAASFEQTRLASATRFECEAMPSGLRFVAKVMPMTYIRRVRIGGNEAFRRKEILKRIFLRAGTPLVLDPTAPEANPQVIRQLTSLKRLYAQSGLDDVTIHVEVAPVDESFFDLTFQIREGDRLRIDEVDARHVHLGTRDPDGLACPTLDPRRLERLIGLGAGDTWTTVVDRQLRERLRRHFQAAGFLRPAITIIPPDNSGRLDVQVETTQCWVIRLWQRDLPWRNHDQSLSFRWRDPIDPDGPQDEREDASWQRLALADWTASLPFGESGAFDEDESFRGLASIRAELRARGYAFAAVSVEHRDLARREERRPRNSEIHGTIDYFITLNLERRIHSIRLEGVHAFPHATLVSLMQTRAYDFFGSAGGFDPARVEADMVALETHYRSHGYTSFRFVDPSLTPDTDRLAFGAAAHPFALEKSPSTPHFTLAIAVDEGLPVTLTQVALEGVPLPDRARLEALTGLEVNRPFGTATLRTALEKLDRDYRQRGYLRMNLTVRCESAGVEVPCGVDADRAPRQSLTILVTEGPIVRVSAVLWRGNAESSPHVLIRDLPKAGDILDLDRINRAIRRMRALGVFNSVRVDIDGLDDPTATEVVLTVAVEEAEFRFLDVALGLRSIQRANIGRVPSWAASTAGILVDQADRTSTGLGRTFVLDIPDLLLTFDFEYLDLNSLGIGNQVRIPFVAGFSLSQFLRLASFNPAYTMPRLFDGDLQLTTRGIAELDRVTSPLDRLELGLEAELAVPISNGMSAGFLGRAGVIQLQSPTADCVYCLTGPAIDAQSGLVADAVEVAADAAMCAGDPSAPGCRDVGFRPQFTLGARWRLDTQDTPLHPTRGVALAASTSFILDRDRLSSAPVFNQFLKWEASARAAVSLQPLVMAGFIRYGGAATFGEAFLPPDERFTLGGGNGMRGFADNGICRYDSAGKLDPTCATEFGGNVVVQGSLELRVPLLPSLGLWLGTFLDVGALAESHATLHLASFRMSSGLGLRWLLGDLFPIRLDVGFPLLERRCVGYHEDGTCTLEEPSQVHFGLLYTF
jgi:outer membrane protein assembly factor BamA